MGLTKVPPEILRGIFSTLNDPDDLAAVCSVCREWNLWATPLLYRRIHIRIQDAHASQDPPPVWVAALRALQENNRRQREAVNSLAIRGGFSPLEGFSDEGPVDLSGAAELLHSLLQAFIEDMPQLKEFAWEVNITPQPWVLQRLADKRITAFTHNCPSQPTPWEPSPAPLRLDPLLACPLESLSLRVVTEEVVHDLASLLSTCQESLRRLQLRFCWWGRFGSSSFDYPASIAESEQWERDQLLPVFRLLAEAEYHLTISELRLSSMSKFRISSLAKVIEFGKLERLWIIDTHVGDYGDDLWQCLTDLGGELNLKSLVTDSESESIGAFLTSFCGLEDLVLCHVDKRYHNIFPSHPGLARHFHTLKRIFLPNDVHGSRYMLPSHVSTLVDNCPQLEELGFAFYEEDMTGICVALDRSKTLKALYIAGCQRTVGHSTLSQPEFLSRFCDHFGMSDKPFFDGLRRLSYRTNLWRLLPVSWYWGENIDDMLHVRGKFVAPEPWVDYSESVMLEPLHLYLTNYYGKDFDEGAVEDDSDDDDEDGTAL